MLLPAFVLLSLASLVGIVLAGMHLHAGRVLPLRWPAWALHGGLGLAGFVALLFGLGGPPRGAALGVAGFGRVAAVLFAIALLVGLAILLGRLRRWRFPLFVVGVHATIAIGAVVVLAAYTLVG
jgi:hypothetical protein